MSVYPLVDRDRDSKRKFATHTGNTEEFISQRYDLYLTSELSKAGLRYRLHARKAHFIDDFLPYKIHCPACGYEMKCVGGPKSLHELGLYECRCSK